MEFCLFSSQCHYLHSSFFSAVQVLSSFFLQLKCRQGTVCSHTGKQAWILQAFSLNPSCLSHVSARRQGEEPFSCWAWALSQTQTDISMMTSKVGLDPWDYSLTRGWECGGNVYKGCRKGIESQWSWEAAIVPDHRIWVWQADYSLCNTQSPTMNIIWTLMFLMLSMAGL